MSGLSAAEINVSLGGIVISNYLSYLTMGIVISAAWTYCSKFPNDTWWFKAPVIACGLMTGLSQITRWNMWSHRAAFLCVAPLDSVNEKELDLVSVDRIPLRILCRSIHVLATHHLISELDLVLPVMYIWSGGSVAADVIITGSMIYYLDLRFRFKKNKEQNQATPPRRFRQIIVRTVECNILSCIAQAAIIGLFNHRNIGLFFVNIRSSHQSYGTSGGFSTSRTHNGRLTTLPTAVYPSTQITVDLNPEAAGDWQEQTRESMSSAKEHDTHVMLSQV
ncbi:hypothetical protein BT96DRAFT_991388 [Gymnopus androsaceus JB14]|uniref:DUF6534 domain-containing protein n=1 Tax=Gymnopus androsaceus JB14 TaxID=1447944 RepID=A0A6A4HWC0_9AGAR|nr:hypothetical protein BT96DRAFT_991388 [Gymnopus androsaceus JB14]